MFGSLDGRWVKKDLSSNHEKFCFKTDYFWVKNCVHKVWDRFSFYEVFAIFYTLLEEVSFTNDAPRKRWASGWISGMMPQSLRKYFIGWFYRMLSAHSNEKNVHRWFEMKSNLCAMSPRAIIKITMTNVGKTKLSILILTFSINLFLCVV